MQSIIKQATDAVLLLLQPVSEEQCVATVHEAFQHGINFIDTSAFYGNGLSEIVSESHQHGAAFLQGALAGLHQHSLPPVSLVVLPAQSSRHSPKPSAATAVAAPPGPCTGMLMPSTSACTCWAGCHMVQML